jgi:hypothetical protein
MERSVRAAKSNSTTFKPHRSTKSFTGSPSGAVAGAQRSSTTAAAGAHPAWRRRDGRPGARRRNGERRAAPYVRFSQRTASSRSAKNRMSAPRERDSGREILELVDRPVGHEDREAHVRELARDRVAEPIGVDPVPGRLRVFADHEHTPRAESRRLRRDDLDGRLLAARVERGTNVRLDEPVALECRGGRSGVELVGLVVHGPVVHCRLRRRSRSACLCVAARGLRDTPARHAGGGKRASSHAPSVSSTSRCSGSLRIS